MFHYYAIEVEATNYCNANCVFCANHLLERERGFIDVDSFYLFILEQKKLAENNLFRFMRIMENAGWNANNTKDDIIFTKIKEPYIPKKKRYISFENIKAKMENYFQELGKEEKHFDSIINPFEDSDYIIACLQIINPFFYGLMKLEKKQFYSFQPVIRSVDDYCVGKPGYLKSFINVGTISLMNVLDDYFKELEIWTTILSRCSIHVSSLCLYVKDKTNAYNGCGLKICVGNEEIGQGNFYEIPFGQQKVFVTDFGFGLERICWAANGFKYFDLIQQSPIDFCLHKRGFNEILMKMVLMIMSGIIPKSTKFGLHLRTLFRELIEKYIEWEYKSGIHFAYNYWKVFIKTHLSISQVENIFINEYRYQINQFISKKYDCKLSQKQLYNDPNDNIEFLVKNCLLERGKGIDNDKNTTST